MNYIHSYNNLTVAMCLVSIQTRTYTHTYIYRERREVKRVCSWRRIRRRTKGGYKATRKKISILPSSMSTRCQYVERERERERGNLSTHADQYHSSIVVIALLSLFFYMCHWTELNFNDSWLCAISTTNYIDLYQIIIIKIIIIIIITIIMMILFFFTHL